VQTELDERAPHGDHLEDVLLILAVRDRPCPQEFSYAGGHPTIILLLGRQLHARASLYHP